MSAPVEIQRAPIEIRRYTNSQNGRALVYRLIQGRDVSEDRITKTLEMPSDAENDPTCLELPAGYINKYHQYQQGARKRDAQGQVKGIPQDLDDEEEAAFELLNCETILMKDVDGKEGSDLGSTDSKAVSYQGENHQEDGSKNAEEEEISMTSINHDTYGHSTSEPIVSETQQSLTFSTENSIEIIQDTMVPTVVEHNLVPSTHHSASSNFLTIDAKLRRRILKDVLKQHMQGPTLCVEHLTAFPPIFGVCLQLRREVRDLWGELALHIYEPLPESLSQRIRFQKYGLGIVYGDAIPHLCVTAQVIHTVSADSLASFSDKMCDAPGLHMRSRVLLPNFTERDVVHSFNSFSLWDTARKVVLANPYSQTGYTVSFAPTNHANLFGWIRYGNLQVHHLIVQLAGVGTWDDYLFNTPINHYRCLPVTALIASIIACKPQGLQTITLTNLGAFYKITSDVWECIPDRTPITNCHSCLDQLVAYPFADGLEHVAEMVCGPGAISQEKKKEGNMFGLMSSMQWQSLIMKARHAKNEPVWYFTA